MRAVASAFASEHNTQAFRRSKLQNGGSAPT